MAKTKWTLLLTTFITSCISLALLITSIATNNWIVSEASYTPAVSNSLINYGLFSGSMTRRLLISESRFNLQVVCLYDYGVCIYSCQGTPEGREDELHRILNREALGECSAVRSIGRSYTFELIDQLSNNGSNHNIDVSKSITSRDDNSMKFIDTGLWLSTIVFLAAAILFAFISTLFTLINIVFNPIEPIFSVVGLYVWNGITIFTICITIILWGSLFGTTLQTNIAITDTLRAELTYSSDGLAGLGYSYWILLVPLILHIGNIGLLLWRKHIIEKEPPPPTITVDQNDFTLMLY